MVSSPNLEYLSIPIGSGPLGFEVSISTPNFSCPHGRIFPLDLLHAIHGSYKKGSVSLVYDRVLPKVQRFLFLFFLFPMISN